MHEVDNPRIAIFSPSIEHSNRFAEMLSAAGIPCTALSKVDKAERRRRLLSFAAGSYQAVCAVDVMNEGIDITCFESLQKSPIYYTRCSVSADDFFFTMQRFLKKEIPFL